MACEMLCPMATGAACPTCGRSIDEHNRHVRFRLPDPVLSAADQERTLGTWMSDDDPAAAVMMQVPGIGAFVRCVLPVRLTGGYTVTFGTWLAVRPEDLQKAFKIWWTPDYQSLVLDGYLANPLPGWDCLGAAARGEVANPDATPVIVSSPDESLGHVLTAEWDHERVLALLPS